MIPEEPGDPAVLVDHRDYLIVWKPHGMATAPLPRRNLPGNQHDGWNSSHMTREETLLDWVAQRYPEVLHVAGRQPHEGGLLHRLDSATAGLVVCARSTPALAAAMEAAHRGQFSKEYRARCSPEVTPAEFRREWPFGNTLADSLAPGTVITTPFRPWGPGRRRVAPAAPRRTTGKPRLYSTEILAVWQISRDEREVCLLLHRGFRHQVRVHLAASGFPICGDPLYRAPLHPTQRCGDSPRAPMALTATAVTLRMKDETLHLSLVSREERFYIQREVKKEW